MVIKVYIECKVSYIPSDALRVLVMSLCVSEAFEPPLGMMGGGTEKSEADALLDAFDKLAVAFGIKLWPAAAINDELDAYMILGSFLREGEV